MTIRSLPLALGLLASLGALAPSAQAANTNPRPTYIRPPPSARWVPKEYVDPCIWHWPRVDQYGGSGGGGAVGRGGGGPGSPIKRLERYGNDDGAPVTETPMQTYTEDGIRKLEEKAAQDDGKPAWSEQTGELTIESRDDTKTSKATDYRPGTNAVQDTRDAVNAKLAEKKNTGGTGAVATVYGPRPADVPVEMSTPAGPPPTIGPGEQYVIVPREE